MITKFYDTTTDEVVTLEQLRKYWDNCCDSDPCLMEYGNFNAWLNDSINNGWYKRLS